LGPAEIDECFAAAAADPGDANLTVLLRTDEGRKISGDARSRSEDRS
jgi:hypothetical protein